MTMQLDDGLREEVENELGGELKFIRLEKGLNSIYEITGEVEQYILKVHTNPENEEEWFKAEPKIYEKLIEELDIPSPEVIYQDLSEESYENMFYIMEKMPGQNPAEQKKNLETGKLENLLFQYGEILAEIHKIDDFKGYGQLSGGKTLSVLEPEQNWPQRIVNVMNAWKSIVEDEWENPPEISYPDREKLCEALPKSPEPVLIHTDNRFDNLLIQEDKITAFLDWSHPETGYRIYDLARAEYLLIDYDLKFLKDKEKEKLRKNLIRGYRDYNSLPKNWKNSDERKIYRYATTLWLAAGFPNWGSKLDDEEQEKMREEIIQRIRKEEPKEFLE